MLFAMKSLDNIQVLFKIGHYKVCQSMTEQVTGIKVGKIANHVLSMINTS